MSAVNYDLTKIKAFVFDVDGVLSPSTIPMSPEGLPMRMANLKDGYAMHVAAKAGIRLAIITGADVPAIPGRFDVIGVQDIFMGVSDKLPVYEKWLKGNGLEASETAYMGDDIPDIPVLRRCGLAVAPRDAAAEVKAVARFVTGADGGYGAARELLEEVLRAKGLWPAHSEAYGW